MVIINAFVLIIAFLSIYQPSSPSNAIAGSYGLKDLENLVVERNVSIRTVRQKMEMINRQIRELKTFSPELSTQYSYYPGGGNIGDDWSNTEHRLSLRVKQDIIRLFKVTPEEVREQESEIIAIEAELSETERLVLLELRTRYTELLDDKLKADSYKTLRDLYSRMHSIIRGRSFNKEALPVDVLRVEKDLQQADAMFRYHQESYETTLKVMAESIEIAPDEIVIEDIQPADNDISLEYLVSSAIQNRGIIKQLNTRILQERSKSSSSYYKMMNLSLFLGYLLREEKNSNTLSTPEVGLTFSTPLSILQLNRVKDEQLMAEESYLKLETDITIEKLKSDIRKVYNDYKMAGSRLRQLDKESEIKKEEIRIERLKIDNTLSSIKVDPLKLLKLETELIITDMQRRITGHEKNRLYWELLFLSGSEASDELKNDVIKDKTSGRTSFHKYLWIWEFDNIIKDDQAAASLVSICEAKAIRGVFLSVNKSVIDQMRNKDSIARIIRNLHQHGVTVSALLGENLWIYPEHRVNLMDHIAAIQEYNSKNDQSAKFDAIHLDIEPHALDKWKNNKREMLQMLRDTVTAVNIKLKTGGNNLMLEIDIPASYKKEDPDVIKEIVNLSDMIVIMAYKIKNVIRTTDNLRLLMDMTDEAGKKVVIGLNAGDYENEAQLENTIKLISDELTGHSSVAGFSIHDFKDYTLLLEKY